MNKNVRTGACLLALSAICLSTTAEAATKAKVASTRCASAAEFNALRAAAVQQELMDAGLGCGPVAMQNYNAFQTNFGSELRVSDAAMMKVFRRVNGARKGENDYHAYKTRAASNAEYRRVRGMTEFCAAAEASFAIALGPVKPSLGEFIANHDVKEASPIGACDVTLAQSAPFVLPRARPDRPGEAPAASVALVTPAAATPAPTVVQPVAVTPAAAPVARAAVPAVP